MIHRLAGRELSDYSRSFDCPTTHLSRLVLNCRAKLRVLVGSLGEAFGRILRRCGRCLELSVASRSSQPGRRGQREEGKSFARNADIVGAPFLYDWRIFEGGSARSPFYPGAQRPGPRNRGLRDGQGFVYCQDDQSVTAGDRCIITTLLPPFLPFPPFLFLLLRFVREN